MNLDQRILVSDFDAVHQADSWRRLGAQEAMIRLTSALRTAVLLGDVVTIDRNQLLDGIYFLSLGPHGIASALGLAPHDPLPMVVTCSGDDPHEGDRTVPVLRGFDIGYDQHISIDRQLEWVRGETFRQASSAMMATRGDDVPGGWLCSPPSDSWLPGSGLTRFQTPLRDESSVVGLIERAQDLWAGAMLDGRVAVDSWTRDTGARPLDIDAALATSLADITAQGRTLTPLAEYLFALPHQRRGAVATDVYDWVGDNPDLADLNEARMAMEAWSNAYYRAIAEQNGYLYLSFFDGADDSELARTYGLALPKRSRFERLKDRAFRPSRGSTIRVEGEILDRMVEISPGNFAQLYVLTRDTARKLITKQDPQAMYDLAFAAREAVNIPPSHSAKKVSTLRRIALLTTLAVVVTALSLLTDLGDLSAGQQTAAIVGAGILGVIAGLPWDDMAEFFRLRTTSMTATLTMSNER